MQQSFDCPLNVGQRVVVCRVKIFPSLELNLLHKKRRFELSTALVKFSVKSLLLSFQQQIGNLRKIAVVYHIFGSKTRLCVRCVRGF